MKIGYYALAAMAQAAGSFLAMALLSRLMSPYEFGRWVLFEPLVLILSQIALFGANHGILKTIAQDNVSPAEATKRYMRFLYWCSPIFLISIGLVFYKVLGIFSLVLLLLFWLSCESVLVFILSVMRGMNKSGEYFLAVSIRVVAIVSMLGLYWFLFQNSNIALELVVSAWGFASFLALSAVLIKTKRASNASPETYTAASAVTAISGIKYGLPILLSSVLAVIISNGDRYVLALYNEAQVVGQYAVFAKVASALNLLVVPINLWWPTARFKHLKEKDGGQEFFSKFTLQLLVFLVGAASFIWLCTPYLVEWLAPGTRPSIIVVGLLLCAGLFTAMTTPLAIGLLKEGNTKWIPMSLIAAAAMQVGFSILFVGYWASSGVAFAAALAAFLSLIIQWTLSYRFHKIVTPIREMCSIILLSGFALFLSKKIGNSLARELLIFISLFLLIIFSVRKKVFRLPWSGK